MTLIQYKTPVHYNNNLLSTNIQTNQLFKPTNLKDSISKDSLLPSSRHLDPE